ncbi:spermidine/putrescine ABC transporter substrate-binding protein [Streptomyces sp. NBC_01012]|uniref:polyamine ABC transporter substrate-binding protein n=1 Tax=Streptomyces sp. NBC_01012 TaxID=2903717 RepID=UPI00386C41BE|nr:spermidine/putrescine ABC transporter substrate-binding protein [Streptomyces sp. NBC_01012]
MEQYEPERLSAPQLAAMRRSLTNGRGALTRRSLLRASGTGSLALGGLGALSACGIPPAQREGDAAAASDDHSAQEKRISFSNWTEYMDVGDDGKSRPTLEAFTKRTGITVKYTEDINDNVEFFGKVKPQLAAGQDTGRDLVIVTDWLAARIIRLGWAQKLDPTNLPHAFANLSAQFRRPDWDPGRAYSYPWSGIPTIIAYNEKATGGRKVDSVTQLLDDPKLKGKVSFLSEMRDSVGMTLLDMGKDPGSFTDADFDAAVGRMQKGVATQQIRRFTGNDYTADLSKGDIAACVAWAGDIIQLQNDNPAIKFSIPSAGYITSSDNMLVPAGARHRANAEKLMDYYYEPPVAAELAAYINYVCPVDGVAGELAKIDASMASNTLILPDRAMVAKSRAFRSLSPDEETAYEAKFAKLIGA